jgi:hypothetical protein
VQLNRLSPKSFVCAIKEISFKSFVCAFKEIDTQELCVCY